jgi:hypothetical protein
MNSSSIVAGKIYFAAFSTVLFGLGLGEVIVSSMAISSSSGYYVGGVYSGILCIVAALFGFLLSSRKHLIYFIAASSVAFIASIISSALIGNYYGFMKNLEACSSYSSTYSYSCGVDSALQCYGSSAYYANAAACEVSYVLDYGSESNQCSCVTSTSNTECYSYTNMQSCENFITKTSEELYSAYIISILNTLLLILMLLLSAVSWFFPLKIATKDEIEFINNSNNNDIVVSIVAPNAQPQYSVESGNNSNSNNFATKNSISDNNTAYVVNPTHRPNNNINNDVNNNNISNNTFATAKAVAS